MEPLKACKYIKDDLYFTPKRVENQGKAVQSVTIVANPVKARLIDASRDIKLAVGELLSYYVEGSEHSQAFKSGGWDGKSSFFEHKTATFPAGFVYSVASALNNLGVRPRIIRKPLPPALGPDVETAYQEVQPFGLDPRYDYQIETVKRLEKYGGMIAMLATGAGKSVVARTVVRRLMRPTLFITTRKLLMYQMANGFEEAGFKVGIMGDGDWRPINGVNCAMVQTLNARLKRDDRNEDNYTRKLLQLFEVAILEEAHEAGGQEYFDLLAAMPNAHYRLALTATPFMRPDAESNMRLMAVCGQIGIKVSEKLLIDREILARPIFKYIDPTPPSALKRGQSWQRAYQVGIVDNENRNRAFVDHFKIAAQRGLSVMALVQRQKHGDVVRKMCVDAGLRADFIFGEHDGDRRKRALERLKSGEIQVLIGSTILDVGVDVPAVGMVALMGGGKAEVALRQRIGRGLRAKKNGPNICLVLDCMDRGNGYLSDHAKERRKIVESTPGFSDQILKPNEDFPWPLFAYGNK